MSAANDESASTAKLERELRKEARDLRKQLQHLSDAVLLHLHALDTGIGAEKTLPRDIGSKMAKIANTLDMENDRIRFSALGVDFRKDDKAKAVAKLMRSNV